MNVKSYVRQHLPLVSISLFLIMPFVLFLRLNYTLLHEYELFVFFSYYAGCCFEKYEKACSYAQYSVALLCDYHLQLKVKSFFSFKAHFESEMPDPNPSSLFGWLCLKSSHFI